MAHQTVKRAVVIGSGMMGPGIAYTLASAGCEVTIYARTESSVERGLTAFKKAVEILTDAECISGVHVEDICNKVRGATELEPSLVGVDLVIESIAENLELKQKLFGRIEKTCSDKTILTSNTSSLPVGLLAENLVHKERFAVTHFWNPPHLMPLVEVVKGKLTSDKTIDTLINLMEKAGKTPVKVLKDTPGQLGNRLFHALLREAIWMIQEGIASAEDVDTAIKKGFGRRFPTYGALEHQDIAGLDMVFSIHNCICKALCKEPEPGRILKEKVMAGNLGAKSGHGFFTWDKRDVSSVIEKRDSFLIELLKSERTLR
jgi:3-hydroxybutyryl-CoA dehydrogenase